MKSVYVAASYQDLDKALLTSMLLESHGWRRAYPWWEKGWAHTHAEQLVLADEEMRAIKKASWLVLVLPGGIGSHLEMGCAIGAGVPVTIVGDSSIRRPDGRQVAWYRLREVELVRSFGDLAATSKSRLQRLKCSDCSP